MTNELAIPNYPAISGAEARVLSLASRSGRKVIDSEFALGALGRKELAWRVLTTLTRKGRLLRIVRGKYIVAPFESPAGAWAPNELLVARWWMGETPYYVGYYTAYRYWGLTDQIPQETFVLNTRVSKRIQVGKLRFTAVKIAPAKYYGVESVRIGDETVDISDRERTIVDFVYRPIGSWALLRQNLARAVREFDLKHLIEYGARFPVKAVRRRLACLLAMEGVRDRTLKPLIDSLPESATLTPLNPWDKSRAGAIDRRYGVIRNAS